MLPLRHTPNMAEKRPNDINEYDVSEIRKSKHAKVHGVVTRHSPVKTSKNTKRQYFDAAITDGKKSVRMVSFLPSLRETLDDVRKTQSTVSLIDCTISSDKGQETIYLNEKTQVQNSPKKFSVPPACGTSSTKMCDPSTLCRNTDISVLVKVVSLSPPETVTNKDGKVLTTQDCMVGDASGKGRLVLWEDVGSLLIRNSYNVIDVGIRHFRGMQFLSITPNSTIKEAADIGDVSEEETGDTDRAIITRIIEGEIAGVRAFSYTGCSACKVKIQALDDISGECLKCTTMVKLSMCPALFTADIRFAANNKETHNVKMLNDVILQLVGTAPPSTRDLQAALLALPALKLHRRLR